MSVRQKILRTLQIASAAALVLTSPVPDLQIGYVTGLVVALVAVVALIVCSILVRSIDRAEKSAEKLDHDLEIQIVQKSERQFRNVFESAAVGMALVSPTLHFLKVNRALGEMLRARPEKLVGELVSLVLTDEAADVENSFRSLAAGSDRSFKIETRIRTAGGVTIWARLNAAMVRGLGTDPAIFVCQFEDITQRKRADERMLHNSLYDELTDLPNRFLFLDRLKVALRRFQRHEDSRLWVLAANLDRFKLVNDRFGTEAGNEVLRECASRLRIATRSANTVARLGVDEFAIYVEDGSFDDMLSVVSRIRQGLSQPFDVNGEPVYLTVSVGIAVGSPNYQSAEDLLRDAVTALKQAKLEGRDRYEIFTADLHAQSIDLLQMETDLRHAIVRGELRLVYQPIVTLETGIMAGFESLVRWNHPTRGMIPPSEFIPIAEATGLINSLGEWTLRESCRQMCEWQMISERADNLWVSVNVSSKQFIESDIVSLVRNVLEEYEMDPRSLKVEITESTMAENIEHVTQVMNQLQEIGVKISIDDFGTGFSSLSFLDRLPLDCLKIDRSFVAQIEDADQTVEIVKTIVSLSQSMDLEIIAEGVETIEQLSQLRRLGCEFGQGYCFAMPLTAESVDELLGSTSNSSALYYLLPESAAQLPVRTN